jgi:drug/metabolite transporter (DMT)-like permease
MALMGTRGGGVSDRAAPLREVRGLVEVLCAMSLAGSTVVVGKLISTRIPVFLAMELSFCAALLAILPAQIALRRELRLLTGRELAYMFLQALFGIVLFRGLTLYGLRLTSAVSAGVITSASPAIMAVIAVAALRERLGAAGIAGVSLSVAGLLLVNLWGHGAGGGPGYLAGNLLVLGATFCEALLTVFRKSSGGRIGSVTNTTVLVAMSALMALPLALRDLRGFSLDRIEAVGWVSVVYYGAVATNIAYILWGRGALRISATMTGLATAALPVTALALSALVLGEHLGLVHLLGGGAVVAGILIGRRQPPSPSPLTSGRRKSGPCGGRRATRTAGEGNQP